MSVSEVFATLFVKAAGAITARQNMLLIIDGIDEMEMSAIKEVSAALFANRLYIPRWLKFFMTSRPDPALTGQLSFIKPVSVSDEIEDYIRSEAAARGLTLSDDIVNMLREHSEGSYLYVSGILDDIARDGEDCLAHLPSGMGAVFTKYFDRQSRNFNAPETTKTLLQVMCAAKEPLSATALAKIIGVSEYSVRQVVGELGSFITAADGGLRFYHKQLKDWLVDESNTHYWVSVADGNRLIADWIAQNIDDFIFDDYMVKYGFIHLIEEKKYDAVHGILAENELLAENAFLDSVLSLAADGKFSVIFKAIKHLCTQYGESDFPLRRTIKHMMENGCYDKCEQYMKSVFSSESTEWINKFALLIHRRVSGNIVEVRALCNESWDNAPADVRADIEFYLGEVCRENGDMEIACGHYKNAIELAAKFPNNSANYLSRLKLIDIAYVEGKVDFALSELKSLKVGESLRQANYLKNRLMGHVKEALGYFDEAKEFYIKSLGIAKRIKKNYLVMESFNSIGGVCSDIDEGFMYLANGRKIARANNYRLEYGKNMTFTSRLFLMDNKPIEAADAAREAETCLLDVGYMPGVAAAKMHYAVALYKLGNYTAAKQLLEESNEIYNRENIYPHLHLAAIEWLIRANQRLCCYSPLNTDVDKLLEANKNLEYMSKTVDAVKRGVLANTIMNEFVKLRETGAYSIGYHNKNYVVEAAGNKYVVREPVEDFESVDIRVNDENDMLMFASQSLPYLNAPQYIGSAYMGDVLCAIHGFVDGKSLGAMYGDLAPIDDRLVDVLAENIAKMHLQAVPEKFSAGLPYGTVREFYDFEKGFLRRLIEKWYALMKPFYDALGLPDIAVMLDDGQNVLTERPFSLCHCDVHRGNLLWDEDRSVMHFIDWELTQIADPVYDIAIHFHKIHYTAAQEKRFLDLYKAATGFDIPDMEKQIDYYRKAEEVKSNIIDGIRCIMEIPQTYDDTAKRFAERYLFKLNYLSARFSFKLKVNSAGELYKILCDNKARAADIINGKA
ncbi:MAG: aminoglycoside phosphotransferase family protein [Clostridiales bacterium]|nr:aminoglycoside phosphotransferase family protein [Clostridiales bacterium]